MKIVIWGHKLYSHSHSYIHQGFFNAFKHLGYQVFWFDDSDDVSNFDFSDSIFLTEGQVDKKIPIRDDCRYILHYCDPEKYREVADSCLYLERTLGSEKRRLNIKMYQGSNVEQIDDWTYLEKDYRGSHGWRLWDNPIGYKALYMLWATDLLPHEFDYNACLWQRDVTINWIGSIGSGVYGNAKEIGAFAMAAIANNHPIKFLSHIDSFNHICQIKYSYLAPAIVGTWQMEYGYIPCRVFKNISYGTVAFTNSSDVAEVMQGRVHYNKDTHQLYYEAEQITGSMTKDRMIECMHFVADNHTYINRVKVIMEHLP